MTPHARRLLSVTAAALLIAAPASAQVIGTFRWQTLPYCNVLSVTVQQVGGNYQLTGSDDQCGGAVAPVTGTAVPTATGVSLGFLVSVPTGGLSSITATISLTSVSGTWRDTDGLSGTLAFNPGATAGTPRPTPTSVAPITVERFATTVYAGTGSAATVARSDHTHDERYYQKTEVDARKPLVASAASTDPAGINIATGAVVATATITAPVAGTIVALGNSSIAKGTETLYSCSLSTSAAYDLEHAQFVTILSGPALAELSTQRTIAVAAGAHTVNMICVSNGGGTGAALRPRLSLIFIPG